MLCSENLKVKFSNSLPTTEKEKTMNELLHPDNPIIRFLTRLFDLMLLNLLLIISCIPIVTIGAAISATYHVIFKIIDKKDPYIVKSYFKAMKENFKHATLLWILILSAGICINTALFFIYNIPDKKFEFLQIPICLFIFILLSVAVYAFPLLSRYQCSMKQLLKNTMILSFTNIPATVIIAVFPLGIFYLASAFDINLAAACGFFVTIGCSGIMYIASFVLFRIFKKYENGKL